MKTIKLNIIKFGLFLLTFTALTSCEYKEIADADFPEGVIYLPVSLSDEGMYVINTLPANPMATEQEEPYQFRLNANEFIIPLSAYRSGLNKGASFTIDIKTDKDMVNALIASEELIGDVELLPEGKYTLDSSVKMESGKDYAPFTLKVNLDYLISGAASKKIYALAVNISSNACESNPELSKVVILISSEILLSSPDFTYEADKANPKQITFADASLYAITYKWNFGNGKTSTEKSPVHIYENAGTYEVKLVTTGVTGLVSEKTETIVIK